MSTILIAFSTWLHTLATIVMVGYYLFTGLIYLPVMERKTHGTALRDLLEGVSSQLRPYFGGALLIFIVTGTHLMLINENYLGLGNFFGNLWSILIIVKHAIVVAFLALGIVAERIYVGKISDDKPEILQRYRMSLYGNIALGLLILLLTSIAQVI
jgi:uncharacterized membrane protein